MTKFIYVVFAFLVACSDGTPKQSALPAGSKVLILGDSLSYGTGAKQGEDYPTLLARATGWDIVNAGVPGDTTAGGLERLPALLAQHQPALLIVELGGNDFLHQLPSHQTEGNLKAIVAQAAGTKVLLLAIPEFSPLMAAVGNLSVFDRQNALKFIARRLLRLVPPYYFAILFALFFLFIKAKATGTTYSAPDTNNLLHHLLFTQGLFNAPYINVVFWTLCIEVQFYIAFALLLWGSDALKQVSNQPHLRLYTIAATSTLALLWPLKMIQTILWQGSFIGFWYSFLAGVMVCWASLQKERLLKFTIIFCIGLLLIGLFYQASFAITASITAATLLFASLKNHMGNWLNWAWLQWLGVVSYSLYLLHNPVTGASANIVKRIAPAGVVGELMTMTISMMACLAAAQLSYLIIERPSIRLSHWVKLKK